MTIPKNFIIEKSGLFEKLNISENESRLFGAVERSKLPVDYLEFVENIGTGEVGDGWFILYSGVVLGEEIFGEENFELDGLLFFGDNMQGISVAIDTINNNSIVEVDSSDMSILKVADDFISYMKTLISD
ncbi:SMI1/KNR4 family protein [Marinomonas agarivorans]|nr:SMI1/KNR4 family protein [Marinomonas agarivorans]